MSGQFYEGRSPDPHSYRSDPRDRDPRGRGGGGGGGGDRVWNDREGSRGPPRGGDGYGRLREDDFSNGGRNTRSPGPTMQRRRPRSRSPPQIDRYIPAGGGPPPGRYGGGDVYIPGGPPFDGPTPMMRGASDYDRFPPPMMGHGGLPPHGRSMAPILLDPHLLDYNVSFQYFSDWWTGTPAGAPSKVKYADDMTMKEKYEAYKEGLGARSAKHFVRMHKDEEWFRERYIASEQGWKEKMIEWRKLQWKIWETELNVGRWDTWLADAREGLKISSLYPNGKQKDAPSETKEPKEPKEEGAMSEDGAIEEETPATQSGTGALRDDSLDRPALLIKTVSPTVSREKLEELASTVHGFLFLSLGDPNPLKKFHRIGWILVDPNSVSEGTLEAAAAQVNEERIHDEAKGDFVVHVGVHNPPKILTRKMLHDVMSLPTTILAEVDRVREVVLKVERVLYAKDDEMMLDEDGNEESYRGWDMIIAKVDEIMVKREQDKMTDEPDEEPEDGEAEDDKPSDVELERAKRTIDIAVEYLRRVFSFCYYCFTEADSIHELVRRCPGGHIRRPLTAVKTAADGTPELHQHSKKWISNLHDRIELFLNPDIYDSKIKLGWQEHETAVQEETNKSIKQEDESKFRCRVKDCTKLFKSEEFVRKHMAKRHSEFITGIEEEVKLVNAYALDPFRVTLPKSEHPPGAPGPPGGMMGGLPPRPGMDPMGRGMMMPYGMYPQPPYGGPFPGMDMANVDRYMGGGRRSVSPGRGGPIRRRGGANPGVARPSPYARPPMGGGRDRGDREREREGRFQAAMAGGGVMPPGAGAGLPSPVPGKDELAGRSLKSYMDLDATKVEVKQTDELDY